MNIIDRLVSIFSPSAALKRVQARQMAMMISERRYDATSGGRRTSGWRNVPTSPVIEIGMSLQQMRELSSDAVRNNTNAHRAVEVISNHVVGTGIRPSFSGGGAKTANTLWKEWAEAVTCSYDERMTFYAIQELAMVAMVERGECLILRKRNADLRIPIQLQLLEADHLDHMYSTPRSTTENYVIQGVEYAPSGKRVAYYIFPFHPAEGGGIRTRVPAEDVIHLFRPRRIGQVRGLPSGTSGHVRMRDLDEFEDAELLKQKVSACFAAFVQDSSDSIVQGTPNAESDLDRIEPGTIETLPTGKSMVFSNPPVTNGQGEFVKTKLRSIASSYGITYESMTSDYSNVNFSSARMGWLEMRKNITMIQQNVIIPLLCDGVFKWFEEAVSLRGIGKKNVGVAWTVPAKDMIDLSGESAATMNMIRGGLKSFDEALREQGYDPDRVREEIAASNKKLDDLQIVLDTDPRYTMKAGVIQPNVTSPAGEKPQ